MFSCWGSPASCSPGSCVAGDGGPTPHGLETITTATRGAEPRPGHPEGGFPAAPEGSACHPGGRSPPAPEGSAVSRAGAGGFLVARPTKLLGMTGLPGDEARAWDRHSRGLPTTAGATTGRCPGATRVSRGSGQGRAVQKAWPRPKTKRPRGSTVAAVRVLAAVEDEAVLEPHRAGTGT